MKIKYIVLLIIIAILLILIFQNLITIPIKILLWKVEISLLLVIILPFISGILVGWILKIIYNKRKKQKLLQKFLIFQNASGKSVLTSPSRDEYRTSPSSPSRSNTGPSVLNNGPMMIDRPAALRYELQVKSPCKTAPIPPILPTVSWVTCTIVVSSDILISLQVVT